MDGLPGLARRLVARLGSDCVDGLIREGVGTDDVRVFMVSRCRWIFSNNFLQFSTCFLFLAGYVSHLPKHLTHI